MRKGSKKLKLCRFTDFTPCMPDNPEQPLCEKGHGWSSECMKPNYCPDYKHAWGITLEAVKKELVYNLPRAEGVVIDGLF